AEDIVARFGGDEFVLLLKGADRQAATAVAERVRDRVRARLGITVSIGLAVLPADAISASELFVVADRRMFEAKRAGRDRLVGG
ncbi:MAG: GGDEF domain-containing protein, partial [Deltaproteobacteria bacterium]|nr:GGDEF domain-containing protein [Deltaproteobacteria bacterium]